MTVLTCKDSPYLFVHEVLAVDPCVPNQHHKLGTKPYHKPLYLNNPNTLSAGNAGGSYNAGTLQVPKLIK